MLKFEKISVAKRLRYIDTVGNFITIWLPEYETRPRSGSQLLRKTGYTVTWILKHKRATKKKFIRKTVVVVILLSCNWYNLDCSLPYLIEKLHRGPCIIVTNSEKFSVICHTLNSEPGYTAGSVMHKLNYIFCGKWILHTSKEIENQHGLSWI